MEPLCCMRACVHACTLAFVCATASIRDCLVQLSVVPSSKRLCCAPLLFLLFSTGVGKKTPSSLSLCSGSWKKKSLSDVAACSHSQNPSSSFSPSLILSSLPLRPNCSQTNTHTLLSCDPLAAPRLVSLIVACVQSGHKPRDQPK